MAYKLNFITVYTKSLSLDLDIASFNSIQIAWNGSCGLENFLTIETYTHLQLLYFHKSLIPELERIELNNDGCCSSYCPSPQWLKELAVHINEFVIWESLVLPIVVNAVSLDIAYSNIVYVTNDGPFWMNYHRFTANHLSIFSYTWDLKL